MYYGRGTGIDPCGPSFLLFDGIDDYIDLGSAAQVDDLPNGANGFSFDFWMYAKDDETDAIGTLLIKTAAGANGFTVHLNNFGASTATLNFTVVGAVANTSASLTVNLNEWLHIYGYFRTVAAGGNGKATLYVDGSLGNEGAVINGAYVVDAGNNLYCGGLTTNNSFRGMIQNLRISDFIRWSATFSPPERCAIPTFDGNTVGFWIYEGIGTVTYNAVAAHSNGALTNGPLWGCDCDVDGVNDPTCEEEVYFANKHNKANITNAYWYDASIPAYSGNLMTGALPHLLLPPVPAVGDIFYMGCDTTLLDSGPFCSAVFDLMIAQVDLTIVWEYWNGAWVAMDTQDNTATAQPLDTTGVKSLIWQPQSDEVAVAVNGVTAYWYRARVTVIGASPAPPWQQNRYIYSVTWANIEIEADQLPGDISMLVQNIIQDVTYQGMTDDPDPGRIIVAGRQYSRGADFTPYLNFSTDQNPSGLTYTAYLGTSTGEHLSATDQMGAYQPSAHGTTMRLCAQFAMNRTLGSQYKGTFHAFLRVYNNTVPDGVDYPFSARLRVQVGGDDIYVGKKDTTTIADRLQILDLGQFTIPDNYGGIDYVSNSFLVDVENLQNPATNNWLYLTELVLMPADEWIGDFWNCRSRNGTTYFDVNSIVNPGRDVQGIARYISNDAIYRIASPITTGAFRLNANGKVRIWYFWVEDDDSGIDEAYFWGVCKTQMFGTARYLSMRGDR